MARFHRRSLLAATAVVGLAGCVGGDSEPDDTRDDDPDPTPALEAGSVSLEFEDSTVMVTDMGTAEHVVFRDYRRGVRDRQTVTVENEPVELDPGHFRVYYEEEPDNMFEETYLGAVRVGEVASEVTDDWLGIADHSENVADEDGTLVPADLDEPMEWGWTTEGAGQVGELVVALEDSSTGTLTAFVDTPEGERLQTEIGAAERLPDDTGEPIGTTTFAFQRPVESLELTLTAAGEGEQIAVTRLSVLTAGPVEIIDQAD